MVREDPLLYHSAARSPSLDLLLCEFSKLVDCRSAASDDTLGHLSSPADSILANDCIRSGDSLDFEDANAGIFWTSVMLSVTEVSEPCLECWRVVLLDGLAVSQDLGGTSY